MPLLTLEVKCQLGTKSKKEDGAVGIVTAVNSYSLIKRVAIRMSYIFFSFLANGVSRLIIIIIVVIVIIIWS